MSDEAKGTPTDESKGKGTPTDESKGTPKDKGKGKLYTVAQIDKIKSDAAAMGQGRAEKVAAQEKGALTQELQSTKSRLDALESQVNESRLADARGDPDKLRAYQQDQATRKREREVAEREREANRREEQIKTDRAEVDKDRGVVSIAYIAAKHGLETEDLESLGISDHDTLEKVAEALAAGKAKAPEGEGEKGAEGGEGEGEFKPDSGETAGSGEPTMEQLEKMTMPQYAAHVAKRDEKK